MTGNMKATEKREGWVKLEKREGVDNIGGFFIK